MTEVIDEKKIVCCPVQMTHLTKSSVGWLLQIHTIFSYGEVNHMLWRAVIKYFHSADLSPANAPDPLNVCYRTSVICFSHCWSHLLNECHSLIVLNNRQQGPVFIHALKTANRPTSFFLWLIHIKNNMQQTCQWKHAWSPAFTHVTDQRRRIRLAWSCQRSITVTTSHPPPVNRTHNNI